MRRLLLILLLATGIATTTAACGSDPAPTTPRAPTPTTAAIATSAPATATPPRVTTLMHTLGCNGRIIGTQLYSRETGRCAMAAGSEVTIATFDSPQLRDQWADSGRELGGNTAIGDGWAAWCTAPDTAATVARKLGGKVL